MDGEELARLADANDQAAARSSLDAHLRHWRTGETIQARQWIATELQGMAPLAAELGLSQVLEPLGTVLSKGNQAIRWLAEHGAGARHRRHHLPGGRQSGSPGTSPGSVADERSDPRFGMIMESAPRPAPMRQSLPVPALAPNGTPPEAPLGVTRLLMERLELVEDLWLTVLRSECTPPQVERLIRLKELSGPLNPPEVTQADEEAGFRSGDSEAIIGVIREMDLADGIAAARAFSLYFQLINILEQHIEEDSYLEVVATGTVHPQQ